jgi:enoyl-CoA hydratase
MILERRREGLVEVLTLNRPDQGNALSPELIAALGAALDESAADDAVRAVVLTAAGDRIFCGGMDLRAFGESRSEADGGAAAGAGAAGAGAAGAAAGGAGSGAAPARTPSGSGITGIFEGTFPKPVVAAVNGAAVGGGFELVLGSDLVVAAEHARFGLPEVKRGLFPAGMGTLLAARIPLPIALELGLTGELIGAARALELGLINRVVPAGDLLDAALERAGVICANGPIAVRVIKKLMRGTVERGPEAGRASPEVQAEVFGSEDAKEGAMAFVEKRTPRWTGR